MIATSVDTTAVLIIAFSAAYHFALFYLFPASWIPRIKSQLSKDILSARSGIVSTVHASNVVLYVVGMLSLYDSKFLILISVKSFCLINKMNRLVLSLYSRLLRFK